MLIIFTSFFIANCKIPANSYKLRAKRETSVIIMQSPALRELSKFPKALFSSDFFEEIVGLDTCYKSKPAIEPFEKALELTNSDAQNCIAIGDRFDLDVQLPLQMGMGGLEVSGVEDLYDLHTLLK